MILRPRQLNAHQHCFDSAEHKEDEGSDDVTHRDRFMIRISEPTDYAARARPGPLKLSLLAVSDGGEFFVANRDPRGLLLMFPVLHFKLCRYSITSLRFCVERLFCGILFPGLICCESTIH